MNALGVGGQQLGAKGIGAHEAREVQAFVEIRLQYISDEMQKHAFLARLKEIPKEGIAHHRHQGVQFLGYQ